MSILLMIVFALHPPRNPGDSIMTWKVMPPQGPSLP